MEWNVEKKKELKYIVVEMQMLTGIGGVQEIVSLGFGAKDETLMNSAQIEEII